MEKETETQFTEPPSNNWKWQLQNSITDKTTLEKHITLTKEEEDYFNSEHSNHIKFKITPYYLQLIKDNPILRKTMIPTSNEFIISEGESDDPLDEDKVRPLPNIFHRYKNRVLLLSTNQCSSFCRFCTRSRLVSNEMNGDIDEALSYIRKHEEVTDCIISGGDALMNSNEKIHYILSELNKIEHVKIIRIGSKIPVALPQRVDNDLVDMLSEFWRKLYINIHFSHYVELTNQTKMACLKLAKVGISLGSQTVLLAGVNDNAEVLKKLFQDLLSIKVVSRYLYSMDRIKGSKHFFVPIERGKEIMRQLHMGDISGMAIPRYVIDSKEGKIPVHY